MILCSTDDDDGKQCYCDACVLGYIIPILNTMLMQSNQWYSVISDIECNRIVLMICIIIQLMILWWYYSVYY